MSDSAGSGPNLDPEPDTLPWPRQQDAPSQRRIGALPGEDVPSGPPSSFPQDVPGLVQPEILEGPGEPTLFHSWPEAEPPSPRIPHAGHLAVLALLILFGFVGSILLARGALHFHLWGVTSVQSAGNDIHYTIGSMATIYLITFAAALLVFPTLWNRGFFAGLQWNGRAAMRRLMPLLGAACICFVLALVDEAFLPGPATAPIDKLFDNRTAAWLLFGFGVTFAPFFEEMAFRGFLLPALCTAFDWSVEQATDRPSPTLGPLGHPRWSISAMTFASVAVSIPFALMHAEQTAWSLGPFLLLLCVSLMLCWARLSTRSLAASTLVHAAYNFLLFSIMLVGTSGFRHLDKM